MSFSRPTQKESLTLVFLGEHNARASLISEALVRAHGMKGVRAFSAGMIPADGPDRLAMAALANLGIDNAGLWPKHWRGFVTGRPVAVDYWIVIGPPHIPAALAPYSRNDRLLRWQDPYAARKPTHIVDHNESVQRLNRRVVGLLGELQSVRSVRDGHTPQILEPQPI